MIIGKYTRELRIEVSKIPKAGMDITEIIDFIEKKIFEKNYLPAFPCTVSINDVAAHYTVFDEGYILKKGDLIKIDFGISKNGMITDNAITIEIETTKYLDLMKANLDALNAVMEKAQLGVKMRDLGKIVYDIAQKNNFNTIQNLSGHQIAKNNLHFGLSVPNYYNSDNRIIEDNMEFAIEPFFTKGEGKVKSCGNSNIIHLIKIKPIRDPIAKKILDYIKENYPYLPFSKRWLVDDIYQKLNPLGPKAFDIKKINYALRILKANNIIYEYDALASVDGEYISQFEDTVVFIDQKKSIITRIK
ncbi:type II methionyl aminopeptidase [bacterium]|nr:type II methionyl aminopeptidase [bacterium]